jgi:hypothetical protein
MPKPPIFPPETLDSGPLVPDTVSYGRDKVEGLHALSPPEQLEWRARLKANADECGCELASRVAGFAVGAYILALLTGVLDVGGTVTAIAVGAGLFAVASAGAKAYALGRARSRLLSDFAVLRAEIASRRKQSGPAAG